MNDCMIDVVCREAALKAHKRLLRAEINTIPYAIDYVNTLSGEKISHACLLFHYKGDTWNYDPIRGSMKVFPDIISNNIFAAAKKVFSPILTMKILKAVPLDIVTMTKEDDSVMCEKIRTGKKQWIGIENITDENVKYD